MMLSPEHYCQLLKRKRNIMIIYRMQKNDRTFNNTKTLSSVYNVKHHAKKTKKSHPISQNTCKQSDIQIAGQHDFHRSLRLRGFNKVIKFGLDAVRLLYSTQNRLILMYYRHLTCHPIKVVNKISNEIITKSGAYFSKNISQSNVHAFKVKFKDQILLHNNYIIILLFY